MTAESTALAGAGAAGWAAVSQECSGNMPAFAPNPINILSLLTPTGMTGALLHVIFHAGVKCALFLTAGIFIFRTGKTSADEYKGIGRKMPVVIPKPLLKQFFPISEHGTHKNRQQRQTHPGRLYPGSPDH